MNVTTRWVLSLIASAVIGAGVVSLSGLLSNEHRMTAVEQKSAAMTNNFDRLESRICGVETRLDVRLTKLENKIDDLDDKLDRWLRYQHIGAGRWSKRPATLQEETP
jgi:hypothetical protein